MATEVEKAKNSNVMGQKVRFAVKHEKKQNGAVCFGYECETVKDAIEKTSDTLPYPVNEYIFWGFVKGYSEEVVINPNFLLCKWLEPNSYVKAEKVLNTSIMPPNKPDLGSDQTIFFLENTGKYTTNITRIPRIKYMRRNFCVSAVKSESLLDALKRDSRFLNPENWTISSLFGNESKKELVNVPSKTTADLVENWILTVAYNSGKRVTSGPNGESDSNSTTMQIKKEKSQQRQSFVEAAKSAARKNLLSGGKRKRLATLVKKKFSKAIDQSKSAWLMEKLVSGSKVVGRIHAECGRINGTCFLVTEDIILTNYHVYEDIIDDIAALQIDTKVKVFFNHVQPNQTNGLAEVEVDIENIVIQCPDGELDYIFLRLKNKCSNQLELGRVSTVNPNNFTSGVITIIGHPDGREKRVDSDCRIFSEHLCRPELLRRLQQPQPLNFHPLFSCKQEIMSDRYQKKIAYDSSFFDGSSGSPVFDDQGKIIAMHTFGWVESTVTKGKSVSIMEFAVPIEEIYYDCYKKDQDVAKMLFPEFSMEVDH